MMQIALEHPTDGDVLTEKWADMRSGPALFVFTASLQLLYMTSEARELSARLNSMGGGPRVAQGVIPVEVMTLCDEILKRLKSEKDLKECEQVQVRRVVGESVNRVLLRGFGFPGSRSLQDVRILILMEAIVSRHMTAPQHTKDRYSLTAREQTVLVSLLKGLTNKEIASRMGITEYTAKDHIKNLMRKTHTTTRTGLLAQILLTTAESPDPGQPLLV
jgi:DNA-binding CsgD family transcriptional regulator